MALPSTSIGESSYSVAKASGTAESSSSHATNFRWLARKFSTQVLKNASAHHLRLEAEARQEQEESLKARMEQSAAIKAEAEQMLGQIKRTVTTRVEYEKIKPELATKEENKEVQGMSAHALGMQAMLTSKAEFDNVMSQIIDSSEEMFEKNLLTLLETEIHQRDNFYQKLKNQKKEPEVSHLTQDKKMKWLSESLPMNSEKSAKSFSI